MPSVSHSFFLIATLSTWSLAPFQCASEPAADLAREETPGHALKGLADEFDRAGDKEARIRTLQYLVERYPRSKFAEEARAELEEMGVPVQAPVTAPSSSASVAPSTSSPSSKPTP